MKTRAAARVTVKYLGGIQETHELEPQHCLYQASHCLGAGPIEWVTLRANEFVWKWKPPALLTMDVGGDGGVTLQLCAEPRTLFVTAMATDGTFVDMAMTDAERRRLRDWLVSLGE